jgi:hypothetical protein
MADLICLVVCNNLSEHEKGYAVADVEFKPFCLLLPMAWLTLTGICGYNALAKPY